MRKSTETIFRMLAMLAVIPVYPKMLSTTEIRKKLSAKNPEFNVDARSIQRNLEQLSGSFPITCEQQGRTNYWFWANEHAITQIPAMDQSTALALKLASEHLKLLIPPVTLHLLEPYFKYATEILQQTRFGKWSEKIHIISRGPELIAPAVKREVQDVVYGALLENKQFEADYKGKGKADTKRHTLNPLGIVFRNGIIYLVATAWDYEDPLHYALHRMSRANLLDTPANSVTGFDLARYVKEEKGFSYPVSGKKIKLRALFSNGAGVHLAESRLSDDQRITAKKDGRMLVEATVADTAELRWWLQGFGSLVEVVGPRGLRGEFLGLAEEMRSIYNQ